MTRQNTDRESVCAMPLAAIGRGIPTVAPARGRENLSRFNRRFRDHYVTAPRRFQLSHRREENEAGAA